VLFEGAELYRVEGKKQETLDKYGHGTPNDWLEKNVYTRYSARGILLMLAIDILLFGLPGITMWAVQMMWIPFFAAGVINGIGHFWGYRNYETPDTSRNVVPWGILIGGEELHNNHHTFASSAKLSVKWWEFDVGWLYIRLLQAVGLAKVREQQGDLQTDADKTQIDKDTLSALVTHRFQLMDRYWREVVLPVFQDEKCKANETSQQNLFRHGRKLLVLEDMMINDKTKSRLQALIKDSTAFTYLA